MGLLGSCRLVAVAHHGSSLCSHVHQPVVIPSTSVHQTVSLAPLRLLQPPSCSPGPLLLWAPTQTVALHLMTIT